MIFYNSSFDILPLPSVSKILNVYSNLYLPNNLFYSEAATINSKKKKNNVSLINLPVKSTFPELLIST